MGYLYGIGNSSASQQESGFEMETVMVAGLGTKVCWCQIPRAILMNDP